MKPLNNLLCGRSDGTTSHSPRLPKNGNQVAGYAALRAHSFLVYPENMWLRHNLKVSLRCNKPLRGVLSRRSFRGALHIDMLATVLRGFK